MKKKPKKAVVESDAEENYKVPEHKTVINVSSKDQLNITLSKCGLQMLSNLGTVRKINDSVRFVLNVCLHRFFC